MKDEDKQAYLSGLLKSTSDEFRAGAAQEHAEMAGRTPTDQEHIADLPGDEPLSSLKAGAAWTPDRIAADPDGYFDAHLEAFKKRSPQQTVEQLRSEWHYVGNLLGYGPIEA